MTKKNCSIEISQKNVTMRTTLKTKIISISPLKQTPTPTQMPLTTTETTTKTNKKLFSNTNMKTLKAKTVRKNRNSCNGYHHWQRINSIRKYYTRPIPLMLQLLFLTYTAASVVVCVSSDINLNQNLSHRNLPTTTTTATLSTTTSKYSQLLKIDDNDINDDDNFRPIIPTHMPSEYLSHRIFTETGQYRVFEPVQSDLRATVVTSNSWRHTKLNNNLLKDKYDDHVDDDDELRKTKIAKTKLKNKTTTTTTIIPLTTTTSAATNVKLSTSNAAHFEETTATTTTTTTTPTPTYDNNQKHKNNLTVESLKINNIPNDNAVNVNNVDVDISVDDAVISKKTHRIPITKKAQNDSMRQLLSAELKSLEELLTEYLQNFLGYGHYETKSHALHNQQQHKQQQEQQQPKKQEAQQEKQQKRAEQEGEQQEGEQQEGEEAIQNLKQLNATTKTSRMWESESKVYRRMLHDIVRDVTTTTDNAEPRELQTGRLFTGLKKVMWPIYMGLQILKSLLLALFLPTILSSMGKLLGKGLAAGSIPLFVRPMEAPQELDFKDPTFAFDDDGKFMMVDDGAKDNSVAAGYMYSEEGTQKHNQYAYNPNAITQDQQPAAYTTNERQQLMQDTYMGALQSLSSASFKNSNALTGLTAGLSGGLSAALSGGGGGGGGVGGLNDITTAMRNKPIAAANVNTFQSFQNVPASSLLLSNYDPFYSPLLSRLDSVFAQLKLNSENENCREKLICLMYANPAKYAPYSNLVSAQLSRELNELRKPTSDNPDILRFFKYMRAAKDGQDGVDCEKTFNECKEFKDFENPAMVSTYHDINKLVQARKML